MPKRSWQERWEETLKEKLIRFNMSSERERLHTWLKNAGFKISFRKRKQFVEFNLANETIAKTLNSETCPYSPGSKEASMWRWCKWQRTDDYGHFLDECIRVGKKYGLRWQTIFEAILLPEAEVQIEPLTKPQWFLEPSFTYADRSIMSRLEDEMQPGTALR